MKKKVIECDACGQNITEAWERFKFKRYKIPLVMFGEPKTPKWSRLDMCRECFYEMQNFIKKAQSKKCEK